MVLGEHVSCLLVKELYCPQMKVFFSSLEIFMIILSSYFNVTFRIYKSMLTNNEKSGIFVSLIFMEISFALIILEDCLLLNKKILL